MSSVVSVCVCVCVCLVCIYMCVGHMYLCVCLFTLVHKLGHKRITFKALANVYFTYFCHMYSLLVH